MSLIKSILGSAPREKALDSSQLADLLWGRESKSGAVVDLSTALRVSTVLACCRVIAEDVAKVPLGLYQDQSDGVKRRAVDHSLHEVLARRPNPWMTSMEFRETMTYHAILAQGGYAFINRVRGEVRELIPLQPTSVYVRQLRNLEVVYEVTDPQGMVATLTQDQVFRVRGPSWNGWSGLEMVRQAGEAVGLAISLEETQARLHANGVQGGGILSTDQKLNPETVKRLREQFSDTYAGSGQFKTKVLDAGLKFQSMMMSGVDAQHLETRKHQVAEVCRFLRVNPVKVFDGDKASTYASVEQFSISHVVDTLLPWFTRWEQALDRSLLTDAEVKAGYYFHHVVQGLLRGDAVSRSNYYKAGINDGWMTRNEARQLEELNPVPGLDAPLKPLNMETVEPDDAEDGADDQVEDAGEDGMGAVATDVPSAAAVQDTALNGAQVASLLSIVQAVAAGLLPPDTARAMILASFPAVSAELVDAMLSGLDGFEQPVEPAAPPPPDAAKEVNVALLGAISDLVKAANKKKPSMVVVNRDHRGNILNYEQKE